MGVFAYINQAYKTDAFKAMYTEDQLEIIMNTPAWATAAFAIAIFGGAIGCVLLLAKRNLAALVFTLSLIGILVQFCYNFFIANAMEVYGPGAIVMPVITIFVGFFLIWYTKKASSNGWLS